MKDPEAAIRVALSETPHDIVVRSLRRRLWKAFELNDAFAALQVYCATRDDWEEWTTLEELQKKRKKGSQTAATATINSRNSSTAATATRKKHQPHEVLLESKPTDDSALSLLAERGTEGILQRCLNPSMPFELDDYKNPGDKYDKLLLPLESQPEKPKNDRKAKQRGGAPRATNNTSSIHRFNLFHKPPKVTLDPQTTHIRMTTPLHEAARLGDPTLLRIMLEHMGADVNVRNGTAQTALHMVAGGILTTTTADPSSSTVVGITNTKSILVAESSTTNKKGLSKIFQKKRGNNTMEQKRLFSTAELEQLEKDRIESVNIILKWRHAHDGSEYSGEGPSVNAVDTRGRTALHYASELGREAITISILDYFGSLMTIIDDHAKTPCELAAERGFTNLAYELEARTLLYIDPYGMDDTLLQSVIQGRHELPRKPQVPPFMWYETFNHQTIHKARDELIDDAFKKMREIMKLHAQAEQVKESSKKSREEDPSRPRSVEEKFIEAFKFKGEEDIKNMQVIHRGHVELFLQYHGNDVREAMIAFLESPKKAFADAGIPAPQVESDETEVEQTCLICSEQFDIASNEWWQMKSCRHAFCVDCLRGYLRNLASSKSQGLTALCPHHECSSPLCPTELIDLTDTDVYEALKRVSAENFISNTKFIKHCPHPDCNGIVRLNTPKVSSKYNFDMDLLLSLGGICTAVSPANGSDPVTYEGIAHPDYFNCRSRKCLPRAHRFCFGCGEEGSHFPVHCDKIDEWKDTIREHVAQVQEDGEDVGNYNDVAQKLWMKVNTRPCPKCKAPIEKDEGCNHMICSNPHCRHEFCWICRNDWKLHGTDTGGFFRCNRWVDQDEHEFYDTPDEKDTARAVQISNEDLSDPRTMSHTYGTAMHETRIAKRRIKEMERFLHHFHRWNAHSESSTLETRMLENVQEKMKPVVSAAELFTSDKDFNFNGVGLSFIYSAFIELLECRSLLKYSYAYSFFRYKHSGLRTLKGLRKKVHEKILFEQAQSELETMTEQLSNAVARKHFRATQSQIMYLTAAAAQKRWGFTNQMFYVLLLEKKEEKEENKSSKTQKSVPKEKRSDLFRTRFLEFLSNERGSNSGATGVANTQEEDDDDEQGGFRYGSIDDDDELEDRLEHGMRTGQPSEVPSTNHPQDWACPACTYINVGGLIRCSMCRTRRGAY